MAVVLHLRSNKPASRAQTGNSRVVVVMRVDTRGSLLVRGVQ